MATEPPDFDLVICPIVVVEEPDDRVDQIGLDIREKNRFLSHLATVKLLASCFVEATSLDSGCYDEKARVTAGKSMYVVVTKTSFGLKSWGLCHSALYDLNQGQQASDTSY